MPEFEWDPFFIDPDTVSGIIADLRKSGHGPNERLSRYLREAPHARDSEVIGMLGLAIRDAEIIHPLTHDSVAEQNWYARPIKWSVQFIKQLLAELRDIICKPQKKRNELSAETHAVIASIAAVIVQRFHIDAATAAAVAVLILLALARATKRAFCKMTDEEVLNALEQEA